MTQSPFSELELLILKGKRDRSAYSSSYTQLQIAKKYLHIFLHILHLPLPIPHNWILDSDAEQGWCCGNWFPRTFEKSKWGQNLSFKVCEDAQLPTLTSLIKRRIVKDRKSEQVSSQMQMWIPLQEIVTWSAARHKRKEEKREGEHLHFFSCRIMWVGGWGKERVTDPDLLVFVFVFVLLHVFLVIQNYVWECVVGSLIHLIKIGLDRWGAGDEKGEKFCVELLQPMIRQLLTIGVLE